MRHEPRSALWAATKVDVERVEITKSTEAGTPTSAVLAEKYVQELGVKPSGVRVLFASVFSTMFGKARDVRDENLPAPHPPAPSPRIEEKGG